VVATNFDEDKIIALFRVGGGGARAPSAPLWIRPWV